MNFSLRQWLLTFVLDFLLKFGLSWLISGLALNVGPLSVFVPAALSLTMLHFLSLGIAAGIVSLLELARTTRFVVTVCAAEALFAAAASFFALIMISQDVGKCPGYTYACPWMQVISGGIWVIVGWAVFLVVLNLLPILISASIGCLVKRTRRSLEKNPAKAVLLD